MTNTITPANALGINNNNNSKFTPTFKKTMDVVFVPETHGNTQIYTSMVYDDDLNKYIPSDPTEKPITLRNPSNPDVKDAYAMPDNPSSQFFFGMITTIGLYMVYRFIEKSK